MEPDYKALAFWWAVVMQVLNFLGLAYVWLTSRQRQNTQQIDVLRERVTEVETALKHVPTREQLDVLHSRITESMESQKEMKGEVHGMSKTIDLIHNFLLNKSN